MVDGNSGRPNLDLAAPSAGQPSPSDPSVDERPLDELRIEDDVRAEDDVRIEDDLSRRRFMGLDFVDAPDLDPVIEALLDGPYHCDRLPLVVTPNVDIMVYLAHQAPDDVIELFEQAQFCLPDGQPIVAASRLVGRDLSARLAGSDLFARLWPRLARDDLPVAVIVSSSGIADELAAQHPRAALVVAPMLAADDGPAMDRLADEVIACLTGPDSNAERPRFVLCGLGNPKDVRILSRILARWPDSWSPPIAMGLGASFAMYLGHQRRAPLWVQRIGMEWFYRFAQEPRRLFRRYFIQDAAFLGMVRREWLAARAGSEDEDRSR